MLSYENKPILITGINGFVGRYLSQHLVNDLKCKYVYGLDKFQTCENSDQDYTYVNADISNSGEIKALIADLKPQIIFHLAANIKPSREICDLDEMIQSNIMGTVNILSAVHANDIKLDSFISMGTCEEYGYNEQPFEESQTLDPVSLYSGTKSAVSMLCRMFYNLYKIPVVTVRPTLVYGPGQNDRFFIIQAIKKLLLDQEFEMTAGEQKRDFIYIDDIIEGLVAVSRTGALAGEAVNISGGAAYSLKEVILEIIRMTGSKSRIDFGAIPYRHNELMNYAANNKKITHSTGWKPKVSLEEGLGRIIDRMMEVPFK